jgi:S-formylglutathione hydrolase FrmB
MFFNSKGEIKYLIDKISMKDFTGLDRIAGWGEQMYSFDATFSKRDSNGQPQHLFDWDSGAVNPEAAKSWAAHDLSKVVSRLSRQKRKSLQGKIHIYVAEDDTFGMNKPVQAFQKILKNKGVNADIRFPRSGGHNIWTAELLKIIHDDMDGLINSLTKN